MSSPLFRQLPAVDRLVADPRLAELPPALVLRAAREVLDALREGIRDGHVTSVDDVVERVVDQVASHQAQKLRHVINATGIVLHTNLGRAPMAPEAAAAVASVARGYSNTELQLSDGKRGGRLEGIRAPLCALLGCEDAIAVNNCASAVVLVLAALAKGREVIVSRGELVEIGGSFRVPDIMEESGATLVEVGTTNRTRAADFERAITPNTALLMRIHPSNFRIEGFTERPTTAELAALDAPLVEDLGSGALVPGLQGEDMVSEVLANGADLVTFSGDKLLGGPQCGVIAGDRELVQRCRRHPLYRALRLDKLVLAGLEATLRLYLGGDRASIPVLRMLAMDTSEPAARFAKALEGCGWTVSTEADVGFSGGGALPGEGLPTTVVALRGGDPQHLAAVLRASTPPVVARVARDALLLDPRTILPGEEDLLIDAVRKGTADLRV